MNSYEPPQKSIVVDRASANTYAKPHTANKAVYIIIALVCFAAAAAAIIIHLLSGMPVNATAGSQSTESEAKNVLVDKLIVLDAGHGGFDPGTIGVTGTEEDELNLLVAGYLKEQLEASGAKVIMTRSDSNAVADTKEADMAKRREIITNSGSDIVVSIHMNSFTDSSVSGPLVLYMPGSAKGLVLAKSIQQKLVEDLQPERENDARAEDLYILRSGNQPCVIVECGYLSNDNEEQLLLTDDYQKKIAKAICSGINAYFLTEQ